MARQLRLATQQREKLVALDNRQLGAHHGGRICRTRHPVEQGYLAKGIARRDDVEEDLLTPGPAGADTDPPAHHAAQGVSGVSAHEDDSAFLVHTAAPQRGNPLQSGFRQPTEKIVSFNDGSGGDRQIEPS